MLRVEEPCLGHSREPIQSTRSRLQPSGMAAAFLYWSVKVSPHVHYLGAGAPSFGESIRLHDGDVVEIRCEGLGRLLSNTVHFALFRRISPRKDSSSSLRYLVPLLVAKVLTLFRNLGVPSRLLCLHFHQNSC